MRRAGILVLAAIVLATAPRTGRLVEAHLLALDLLRPGWRPTLEAASREARAGSPGGDLYRPLGRVRGGIVLVPGLSRAGKDHPAFQRMASSLARAGFLVLAPDLPGLRAFHVSEADVERIVRAVQALAREAPPPIGVFGFSFGAGPALLAAADPRVRDTVAFAGSFAGYWDLASVISFTTTGWFEEEGQWQWASQQSGNRWKLLAALAPYASSPGERARLQRLADRKLMDTDADLRGERWRLRGEGWRFLAVVENRQRDRVPGLLASLSPRVRARLWRLSPARSIQALRARLYVVHGRDDDSIPYTESVKLARAAPNLGRLVIFDAFTHALPSERGWLTPVRQAQDLGRLVLLLDDLLALRR